MKHRIIALDGSPKAGKTELAKRIIVNLKAKRYTPVVIESSNAFFNLYDLYSGKRPYHAPHHPHPKQTNHYTGQNMYKDCFFTTPINEYLENMFKYGDGCQHSTPHPSRSHDKKHGGHGAEFVLNSIFALYYQSMAAAETALAVSKKNVVIMDGSPFEAIVWFMIFGNDPYKSDDIAINMLRRIQQEFPITFEQMFYVLTDTSPLQIYDRTRFDERAFAEYLCFYENIVKDTRITDDGQKVQMSISYINDFFQVTRNYVRQFNIEAITVPGNYVEEISRNASKITDMFPPLTTKNDGFPGN